MKIPQIANRHNCWKKIAENKIKEIGWQKALQQVVLLQNEEARLYYLKGWSVAINQIKVDANCLKQSLYLLVNDTESIEALMLKHALYELFYGKVSKEQIHRLNKSLNIQWAIDIKAKFPKELVYTRLSSNLDTWLHEIADEDDRDDIKSWAEKVKDGKMLEEKFSEKVKNMN